jgi:hypothetical protein
MGNWTLFSNHGHVLVCLARDPEARLRDVATNVGITERAVQKIVRDLQDGGMVSVAKRGRRNRYQINNKVSLRHALEAQCTLGDLIRIVDKPPGSGRLAVPGSKQLEKPLRHKSGPRPTSVAETRPIGSKPFKAEPEKPVTEKPRPEDFGSGMAEPGESTLSDSMEIQQGSLF